MKTFLKWLGRLVIAVVALVLILTVLIAGFYGIENWRGKRAWEQCKAQLTAKGEKLNWKDFVPPPVPAAQNFAASPLFLPLFDYKFDSAGKIMRDKSGKIEYRDPKAVKRLKSISVYDENSANRHPSFGSWLLGKPVDLAAWQAYYQKSKSFPHPAQPQSPAQDVLFALAKYDPEIAILQKTASRPYSRFPLRYQDGLAMMTPHLSVLQQLELILYLRASAHLALNQTDLALNDIRLQFRLVSSLNSEPDLISYLVKVSLFDATLQSVWEGLASRQWSPSQLAKLSRMIQQFDFLKDFQQAIRGERAMGFNRGITMLQKCRKKATFGARLKIMIFANHASMNDVMLGPEGWLYQTEAFGDRFIQDFILPQVDDSQQRIHKELQKAANAKLHAAQKTLYGCVVRNFFSGEIYESIIPKTAQTQTRRDLVLTAIALERYRLANGELPATLAALHPQFLAKIPHDVMNGKPLKYRREANGRYLLYSVGWDETDDGGKLVFQKGSKTQISRTKGDWLWPMPAVGK